MQGGFQATWMCRLNFWLKSMLCLNLCNNLTWHRNIVFEIKIRHILFLFNFCQKYILFQLVYLFYKNICISISCNIEKSENLLGDVWRELSAGEVIFSSSSCSIPSLHHYKVIFRPAILPYIFIFSGYNNVVSIEFSPFGIEH